MPLQAMLIHPARASLPVISAILGHSQPQLRVMPILRRFQWRRLRKKRLPKYFGILQVNGEMKNGQTSV